MARNRGLWGFLVAGLAACGGGGTNTDNNDPNPPQYPGDPGGTPVQAAVIDVVDNQFSPNGVVIAVGGTVTFRWAGIAGHSVTPAGNPGFSPTAGVSYPPKELVVTFNNPGTYNFYCTIHGVSDGYGGQGTMTGTIVVR